MKPNPAEAHPTPPRLARLLLWLVTPRRDRRFLMDDLADEFHILIADGHGVREARRWYWNQAWTSLPSSLGRRRGEQEEAPGTSYTWLSSALQDVQYAVRRLRKRPRFTIPALVTLVLGIGANTAIFSVANTVLLRPLPFLEPDQLLVVRESNPRVGSSPSYVSPPTLLDLQRDARVFSQVAATSQQSFELTGGSHPQQVSAVMASPNLFSLLGVGLAAGSDFPETATEPGNDRVVVLSYAFWQRWFGGDRGAIGTTLELDGSPYRIAGVLSEGFWFPESADLWAPLAFGQDELTEGMRGARYLDVLARLQPGISLEQARSELSQLAEDLGAVHPNNAGWGFQLEPLSDHLLEAYRRPLLLLLVAAGFVLCIACANVVNLVLVRATEGRREIAMRAALGATRWRLRRESLLEHLLLALLAGALGAAAAFWTVAPLTRLAPAEIPRLDQVALDGGVFVFCAILCLAVGLVLTLVAGAGRRLGDSAGVLRVSGVHTGDRRSHRLRQSLIVGEVALSLVLLIGAGLILKSHARLSRVDPGFSPANVLTASLSLPSGRYATTDDRASFYEQLLASVSTLDGVRSVGATTNLPMAGSTMRFGFSIDGRPEASMELQLRAEYHATSPGYFRTMGIALQGRPFQQSDNRVGAPVVIINESLARRFWPDSDPLGERITVVSQQGPVSREIVGVVADVRHAGLASDPRLEVYVPLAQDPWPFVALALATTGEESAVVNRLRDQLAVLDPALPVSAVRPMERLIAEWLAPLQFQMVLIGAFALLALVLALLGMYGVISYIVSRRTREFGIRMALGADRSNVFTGVLGHAAALALVGIAVGSVAALMLTRSLAAVLYEVSPSDPATFLSIAVLVFVVSAAAWFVPASRAAAVDPVAALREE